MKEKQNYIIAAVVTVLVAGVGIYAYFSRPQSNVVPEVQVINWKNYDKTPAVEYPSDWTVQEELSYNADGSEVSYSGLSLIPPVVRASLPGDKIFIGAHRISDCDDVYADIPQATKCAGGGKGYSFTVTFTRSTNPYVLDMFDAIIQRWEKEVDWKSYLNERYGFSLSYYPPGWKLKEVYDRTKEGVVYTNKPSNLVDGYVEFEKAGYRLRVSVSNQGGGREASVKSADYFPLALAAGTRVWRTKTPELSEVGDNPYFSIGILASSTPSVYYDSAFTSRVARQGGLNFSINYEFPREASRESYDRELVVVMDKIVGTLLLESEYETDEWVGAPVIERLSPTKGRVGTVVDLIGKSFVGFKGDLDAWIENSKGEKAYLPAAEALYPTKYKEIYSGKQVIRVKIESKLCKTNESHSGNPCKSFMTVTPGLYKIFTVPLGKASNKVSFEVLQ